MSLSGGIGSAALGGRLSGALASAPDNGAYDANGEAEIVVVKGVRYRWTPMENDSALVNSDTAGNSEVYTVTTEFIAWSEHVILVGAPNATITAVLAAQAGWQDHYGGLLVVDWLKHPFNGERRLFFVGQDGFVNLYEETFTDMLADQSDSLSWQPIHTELISRGYTCSEQGWAQSPKRWRRGQVSVKTWNPHFSVQTVFDGVAETLEPSVNGTRNRAVYLYPFTAARYDTTNANNDHGVEGRQDYSIVVPETATLVIDNSGFNPDLHQETTERFTFRRDGTYCQLRILNTQGRCEVTNAGVQAIPGPRRYGTLA